MVAIPQAARVHVIALGEMGAPAPGVEIRLYATSWAADCPVENSCALPARLRADVTTAADGSASFPLAAP